MKLDLLKKYMQQSIDDEEFRETLLEESLKWINERINQISEGKIYETSESEAKYSETEAMNVVKGISVESTTSVMQGKIYQYLYYAKTKVNYYDRFPLTLVLEKFKGGFIGLNFHYLNLDYRFVMMDQLWSYVKGDPDNLSESAYFNIRYRTLKSLRGQKLYIPCVKKYLYSQLKSPFYEIPSNKWLYALMLPSERFFTKDNTKIVKKLVHYESKLKFINSNK